MLDKLFTQYASITTHQAVQFAASQGAVIPCDWEGNCSSGTAVAMPYKLQLVIRLRPHGLRKGDEHLTYTPDGLWNTFPIRYEMLF